MRPIQERFNDSINKYHAMERELQAAMRQIVRNFWMEFPRENMKSGIMLCIRSKGGMPWLVWRKFFKSKTSAKMLWGEEYPKLTREILKYRKNHVYQRFKEYDAAVQIILKKRTQLVGIRKNFIATMANMKNISVVMPTPRNKLH